MIVLFHRHDIAAESLSVKLFHGDALVATVSMEPHEAGDLPNCWRGELDETPEVSRLYFTVHEDGASEAAAVGFVSGLVDDATVWLGDSNPVLSPDELRAALGLATGNLDTQLGDLVESITETAAEIIDHGDQSWSQAAAGSEIAQFIATYLGSSKRITFDGHFVKGSDLKPDLVQGASYLDSHGRALRFSAITSSSLPSGTTAVLRAVGHKPEPRSFEMTGTVIDRTNPLKVVQFEVTSQQSAEWVPGTYQFQIDLVFPGDPTQTAPFLGPGIILNVLPAIP